MRVKKKKERNNKKNEKSSFVKSRASRTISNSNMPKIGGGTEGLDRMQNRNSVTKSLEQVW